MNPVLIVLSALVAVASAGSYASRIRRHSVYYNYPYYYNYYYYQQPPPPPPPPPSTTATTTTTTTAPAPAYAQFFNTAQRLPFSLYSNLLCNSLNAPVTPYRMKRQTASVDTCLNLNDFDFYFLKAAEYGFRYELTEPAARYFLSVNDQTLLQQYMNDPQGQSYLISLWARYYPYFKDYQYPVKDATFQMDLRLRTRNMLMRRDLNQLTTAVQEVFASNRTLLETVVTFFMSTSDTVEERKEVMVNLLMSLERKITVQRRYNSYYTSSCDQIALTQPDAVLQEFLRIYLASKNTTFAVTTDTFAALNTLAKTDKTEINLNFRTLVSDCSSFRDVGALCWVLDQYRNSATVACATRIMAQTAYYSYGCQATSTQTIPPPPPTTTTTTTTKAPTTTTTTTTKAPTTTTTTTTKAPTTTTKAPTTATTSTTKAPATAQPTTQVPTTTTKPTTTTPAPTTTTTTPTTTTTTPTTTTTTTSTTTAPTTTAARQCGKSATAARLQQVTTSRLFFDARIVGGTATGSCQTIPWQVRLRIKEVGATSSSLCGGSIIDATHILTAAHCVTATSTVTVTAGEYDLSKIEGTEQIVAASSIAIHPNYKEDPVTGANLNDVAVITLSKPLNLSNPCIVPICLDPTFTVPAGGSTCTVSGWGTTSSGGSISYTLQQVNVETHLGTECQSTYGVDSTYVPLPSNQLCAGDPINGGVDSCQGDSGGPLTCKDTDGSYVQVGVVSYGLGCAQVGNPGIYTSVSAYYDWIMSKV